MAISPFVTNARQKIRVKDVQVNRPNSEAVNAKISGSVNYLLDSLFFEERVVYHGYFGTSSLFIAPPIRIQNQAELTYYYYSIEDSGDAGAGGTNAIDFEVLDSAGAVVGDLFGVGANALQSTGGGVSSAVIGRDIEGATTFSTNASGFSSFQFGTPSITTFQAGYVLRPFVRSFNTSARSASVVLRFKES